MSKNKDKVRGGVLVSQVSIAELAKYIGKTVTLDCSEFAGTLKIQVKVLDFKPGFGRLRAKVVPIAGEGEALGVKQ